MKSQQLINFEGSRYNRSYDLPNVATLLTSLKEDVKMLHHYTAVNNAKYLVGDNAVIQLKHVGLMDDVEEVRIGTHVLVKFIGSLYPNEANEIIEVLHVAWNEYDKYKKSLHDNWQPYYDSMPHSKLDMIMHLMPYVFCLSLDVDNPYQWRNYTCKKDRNAGGYCFSFSVERLRAAIMNRNKFAASNGSMSVLMLTPCFYVGVDDELISQLAHALISDVQIYLNDGNNMGDIISVLGAIFTIAPLIKGQRYFREHEYRLILFDPHSKVEVRKSSGLILVGDPIDKLMSSIMISPQGDKARLRSHLLGMCPLAKDIVIESRVHESVVEKYITREDDVDSSYEEFVLEEVRKNMTAPIKSQEDFLL